jgi:hypothetical protein
MTADDTFTCATCDVTIDHHPVFHLGLAFCCAGCAADGPCMCSYDPPEDRVTMPPVRAAVTASDDAVPPLVEPPVPTAVPAVPVAAHPAPPARRAPEEVETRIMVGAARR